MTQHESRHRDCKVENCNISFLIETKNYQTCDINGSCLSGNDKCVCNGGFEGDGITCNDIDECALNQCEISQFCSNTVGSFTCNCDTGYTFDGMVCVDIDECQDNSHSCAPNENCLNSPGGYTCLEGKNLNSSENYSMIL